MSNNVLGNVFQLDCFLQPLSITLSMSSEAISEHPFRATLLLSARTSTQTWCKNFPLKNPEAYLMRPCITCPWCLVKHPSVRMPCSSSINRSRRPGLFSRVMLPRRISDKFREHPKTWKPCLKGNALDPVFACLQPKRSGVGKPPHLHSRPVTLERTLENHHRKFRKESRASY